MENNLDTWLEPESKVGPKGSMTRKGNVRCKDGKIRRVCAGLPNERALIPAYTKIQGKRITGFVQQQNGEYIFQAHRE